MTHRIYRVVNFEIVGPYTLRVAFDDGTEQVIDFQPVLEGALYAPLQDETVFNQVEIDKAGSRIQRHHDAHQIHARP